MSAAVAHEVANTAAGRAGLFAAFLGCNPIAELLAPYHALPASRVSTPMLLTGKTFFPHLIHRATFHAGLVARGVRRNRGDDGHRVPWLPMFNPGRYGAADGD